MMGPPPNGDSRVEPTDRMRIGDIAAIARVSPRTLRYYEERGIFTPAGYTAGGDRRYGPDDLAQIQRILDLRDGLGLNLDEVKTFIDSERRLAEIRTAYRGKLAEEEPAMREVLLEEGIAIRSALVDRIQLKLAQLQGLNDELASSITRTKRLLRELRQESNTSQTLKA
jgi:MerR family transcriptional regulator, repressor of the yfmOP operon